MLSWQRIYVLNLPVSMRGMRYALNSMFYVLTLPCHISPTLLPTFQVAHEKKELLSQEYPLILAVPPGSTSPNSLPMIDASVGPNLKWTLSSVNHVLRTASKYGEPTYIFAGILDNDPQAFAAVTLRKSEWEWCLMCMVQRACVLMLCEACCALLVA
jgi:hypothetical protein